MDPSLSLEQIQQEMIAQFPEVEEPPLAQGVLSRADTPAFRRKVFFAEKHSNGL